MKIAIISDIHEDLISLKQALKSIARNNCDEIICLGDISGFSLPFYSYTDSRNASECLNLIKENCKIVILGNHDLHAGSILPKNCSFFNFPDNWYQLNYQQRNKLAQNSLWLHDKQDLIPNYNDKDIKYLNTLSEYFIYPLSNSNILFSHYAYPNLSGIKKEFYNYKFEFRQHFSFMENKDCSMSFISHAHTDGFYTVTKQNFKRYNFEALELGVENIIVGIPAITSQQKMNGYAILDSNTNLFIAVKL